MGIVIKVENLGKKYIISHQQERYTALRDVMANAAKKAVKKVIGKSETLPKKEEFWALKNVDFEVSQGDRIGIIGRNGAGKSTLLKLLSRITEPTEGKIKIKGKVASLLEVGTGFHPELTGRENVYLNGAIMGMSKKEILKKFDEIIEFAGVEKFLDTPVKRYSSGMYVRLAFAVAAHLDPEILLVDEVLAVGDAQFQKKSLGKMEEASEKEGRTILFVSHNMAAIKKLCSLVCWIDDGRIKMIGNTSSIVDEYLEELTEKGKSAERIFEFGIDKDFQLQSVRLLNHKNEITESFDCDFPIKIELVCLVNRKIPGLYGYIVVSKPDGTIVIEGDSYDSGDNPLENLDIKCNRLEIIIPRRTLAPGNYNVYINFTSTMSLKGFDIESPGYVCSFNLSDPTSRRGNNRNGFFSTLLKWNLKCDL